MATLYTIGYATKTIDLFIDQLNRYGIDAVADIRSVPYSRAFHDFNRESLEQTLHRAGLRYVYLGDELGPRSKDPAHYDENDQVQYQRLMNSVQFQRGIERLENGINKGFRISLMCAEKDPLSCHRSLLVGEYFARRIAAGASQVTEVLHIGHEGDCENNADLRARLIGLYGLDEDLLSTRTQREATAYRMHLARVAYRRPTEPR